MTEPMNAESVVVQVSPQTDALVEQEMAGETDEIKQQTKSLIEALKMRAQVEAQSAGTLTREAYLTAVRKARESVEQNHLIDKDRIAKSIELIQEEAEKNWESIVREFTELGDRLSDAAKAAWDVLIAPRPPHS